VTPAVDAPRGSVRPATWEGAIVDVDVHAEVASIQQLMPYLPRVWQEWVTERGYGGPVGSGHLYPLNAPTTAREEWRPSDGRRPASDVDLLREHVLDPGGAERAIVNCYYAVDSLRHPDAAAALASAVNDWLVSKWLEPEPRLAASLVVPARDPAGAAKEIRRVGGHRGFVQVLLPVRSDGLYGNRIWRPLIEAAVELDLVLGIHWGGTPGVAPTSSGWPSWYAEEYAGEWQAYMTQVTSLIAEGVFQLFPSLRVSLLEGGFTWMPLWGWRLNKDWRGLRRDVPWIKRPPIDLMREHMRFSTAPIDAGPVRDMARLLQWIGSEDVLMYATDYPHRHDDDMDSLLALMPESMRPKVMAENARQWYRF
jgi:uncharacterized protein